MREKAPKRRVHSDIIQMMNVLWCSVPWWAAIVSLKGFSNSKSLGFSLRFRKVKRCRWFRDLKRWDRCWTFPSRKNTRCSTTNATVLSRNQSKIVLKIGHGTQRAKVRKRNWGGSINLCSWWKRIRSKSSNYLNWVLKWRKTIPTTITSWLPAKM